MIALILARIALAFRRARYVLRDEADRAPAIPGPCKPQASRTPDEDTGILAAVDMGAPKLTESELAYLDWLHGLWTDGKERGDG